MYRFFEELNDRIDYWNTFGLPILEEMFVALVWSRYDCDRILSTCRYALNDSEINYNMRDMIQAEILDVVNYSYYGRYREVEDIIRDIDLPTILDSYKIVPPDYVEYSRKRKNQKDIDAKVVELSYRAMLGYYSDGDEEVYIDPTKNIFTYLDIQ